jgi:Mrp family chromosome partitioning ATPase
MRKIGAELRRQRGEIAAEVRKVLQTLADEVAVAERRVADLDQRLAAARERAAALKERALRLAELDRKVAVERQVYETLLAQLKHRSLATLVQRPLARIISRADPPGAPAAPNVPLLMGLALLAAIPAGVVAAVLRAQFDGGIANRPQAEQATGVPALALVPEVARRQVRRTPADQVLDVPDGLFTESVRRLNTAVRYARAQRPLRSILVTSADTREGKSTLALAIARLLARQGESVLLIEVDLRQPQLRHTLRLRGRAGLADVLRGDLAAADVIGLDPRSPAHVLPGGGGGDAARLLHGPDLAALVAACGRHYDRIILDAPPVLLVSDPVQLAPLADVALLAVRWGRTRPDSAAQAVRELSRAEADVVGVALTRVDPRRYGHDGAGDEVAYGAKARAYYGA